MDSQCDVPVYTIFSSGDLSSGHLHPSTISTSFGAGGFIPSPEYGTKQLNTCIPLQNALPQQLNTASILYSTSSQLRLPPGNVLKQKVSSSVYPQNGLKIECFDNHDHLMVVTPEDTVTVNPEIQDQFISNQFLSTANQFEQNYPPTPTSPNNENFLPDALPPAKMNPGPALTETMTQSQQADLFYEQGQCLLHIIKPRNTVLAVQNFMTAASLGSQRAKHQVAYCFQHGIGVEKDEVRAVKTYMELSDAENPSAASLCQLGICFQMGIGVKVNERYAVKYYERAVHYGSMDAMFNLAYCLRRGLGTPIDNQRAFGLYIRLAELGDPQGMKLIGDCKSNGIGTPKDETEALKWYHQSSKNEFYWGGKWQYALSLIDCPNPNYIEAFRLIREVCENFPICPGPNKLMLGRCYHFEIGCRQDLQKALYWYERALQSYFMPIDLVKECESLINDIRIRQGFNPALPMVIKSEQIIFDQTNGGL